MKKSSKTLLKNCYICYVPSNSSEISSFAQKKSNKTRKPFSTQWISLLYRRVQKIEQIKPDYCKDIKKTALKNAIEWHWSHTSE